MGGGKKVDPPGISPTQKKKYMAKTGGEGNTRNVGKERLGRCRNPG